MKYYVYFQKYHIYFPLGKIENLKQQYYISTHNDKRQSHELENTILNIDNQRIELKDIAKITKRYEDASTLASMNGNNSITLAVSQNPKGDAVRIAEDIKKLISKMKVKGVNFDVRMDKSTVIKDRLNIVISNILLGVILITVLTAILINVRIAFIIALGIPTSFVMGAIYFYFTGHSINVNSLVGVLIAIGIIVDDAIVVSENIQQYIEKGYSPREAAFLGTTRGCKTCDHCIYNYTVFFYTSTDAKWKTWRDYTAYTYCILCSCYRFTNRIVYIFTYPRFTHPLGKIKNTLMG